MAEPTQTVTAETPVDLPPRDRPLPADWTVRQGRDAYLAENGFTVASYDANWTDATLLGIPMKVPNTRRHRFALMMHDLHHVATGYGTDHPGEAEISAWETRHGLRPIGLYTTAIVLTLAFLGLFFAPGRVRRAWRAARTGTSLFHMPEADYDSLLELTVGELRARLGIPEHGLAREPRGLHPRAPSSTPRRRAA